MSHTKHSPASSVMPVNSRSRCPHHALDADNVTVATRILHDYDHMILDCDGVLYVDSNAVAGSAQTVNRLRDMGKKLVFATNSSIQSRSGLAGKLTRLGFRVHESELFPSSFAAAVHLSSARFPSHQRAFVVGMSGIVQELSAAGHQSVTDRDSNPDPDSAPQCHVRLRDDVGAVVVGYDNQFTFTKLATACSYASQPHCLLICCNGDESFPSLHDRIVNPGPGKLVAAIAAGTDKQFVSIGKPTRMYFDLIMKANPGMDRKRTIMIGDRLTTDMVFARTNGIASLFVQSGIQTLRDMHRYGNSSHPADWDKVPDYYAPSLATLTKYMT